LKVAKVIGNPVILVILLKKEEFPRIERAKKRISHDWIAYSCLMFTLVNTTDG
jgi:hypothetical protein